MVDHGTGIEPDRIEAIFNPFFTTKSNGTGLGLAIVSKIIDEHGGKIHVRKHPGRRDGVRGDIADARTVINIMKPTVLIVEDEEKLRRVIQLRLSGEGYEVTQAASAEEALPLAPRADLILSDLRLPNMNGLELLALLRRQNAMAPVILMTAHGSVGAAVEAMKAGAADFLEKPFALDHLSAIVHKALEVRTLRDENRKLKEELGRRYEIDNIIGRSRAMQEIFATVMHVAPTRSTVLLAGESGVGKDSDRPRHPSLFTARR